MHVIVLLYVDDMIDTGNNDDEITKLPAELFIWFEMKDLGELSHFLGLEVSSLKGGIFVSQQDYVEKLVGRFGLNQSKWCPTALDANIKPRHEEGKLLPDPHPYRALVGSLIYLIITRLDIAFLNGLVSRYMQTPQKPHLEARKRTLKYVYSTLDMGLFLLEKRCP